jgi:hypothetical protein
VFDCQFKEIFVVEDFEVKNFQSRCSNFIFENENKIIYNKNKIYNKNTNKLQAKY